MGRTRCFVRGAAVFACCLVFSGCVIYPEGEDRKDSFAGFPSNVQSALRNNGVTSFKTPSETGRLRLDPGCSDYTGTNNTFLLSYTSAAQEDFDNYTGYLLGVLGNYVADTSVANYSCYTWRKGNAGIELGFSSLWVSTNSYSNSVSALPPYTLYLLILMY